MDGGERGGEILRERPFDLADEAQGQMKIVLGNPAQFGAVIHCIDQ
jgi:hypothetical protein